MRTNIAIAILVGVLGSASFSHAQSCYSPVSSWQGNYSLSGTGSGSCEGGICTLDQSVSATVAGTFSFSCTPDSLLYVIAGQTPTKVSVSAVATIPGSDCTEIYKFEDTGLGGWDPPAGSSVLQISVSGGTYMFLPDPRENVTETESGCFGGQEAGPETSLAPTSSSPTDLTFQLPAKVQPLVHPADTFSAQSILPFPMPSTWTYSFTLTPVYDCKPCREKGSKDWIQPLPISSSISPENGSLGEDLPIADTPFFLHYESGRAPGAGKDPIATADASMLGGWTFNVHHAFDSSANTLFLGDGSERSGYELGTPVSLNGNSLVTSEDGSEVYVFSSTGKHLETLRPMTGAVEYTFGYDSAGNLITITDVAGNVTTIQRNGSEQATAIVSPYGQTTTLTVDSNGFLSKVTDPLGNSSSFQNSTTGLLQTRTDANGNVFNYTYDGTGKLIKDADSLGGFVSLAQADASSGFGWTASQTTSMDRTSSFTTTMTLPWIQDGTSPVTEEHTNIWPDGLQATSSESLGSGQLTSSVTLPDGTSDSTTMGPDPRWGIQDPVTTSETLTQGSLTMNITGSRAATLGTAGNPFTLTSQTDTQSVNGRTYTSLFTTSDHTYVDTTPVGRKLTTVLDSDERISSAQIAGLTATDFAYDTRGRLSTITQGTRKTSLSYDSDGRLSEVTDPLELKTSFGYDADGRLTSTTLPDSRVIGYQYDANGNLTAVIPPGKSAHHFDYNAVNLATEYQPPTVSGTGVTTYAYDLDRDLTKITRPDGKTISFDYDTGGRVSSIVTPTETINYAYNSTTGNLSSASISGEALAYGYNGPLPISTDWTGTVAGTVGRTYNDNFWIASATINGANAIDYTYDNDGLVTKAGALTVTNNTQNGLITGTTLGSANDTRTYDSFGELTGYTASYAGTTLYSVTYVRDADGRVESKTETIGGKANTYAYNYDPAGRLISVSENGSTISTYTYDTNSNRVGAVTSAGSVSATYDAQDRLLTYGSASYTYTANGELESQAVGTAKTEYQYDVLGNLKSATLPSGKAITYIVDAGNRRIGKKVNGTLTQGFLYNRNRIVAQLNASNGIVSQFVYATGNTSPDYMISGGVTYRIFSDQLGSPRLVVNTSTGAIAEQITYNEFGNVLTDSNPGFQPFGFAGGLYDQDTKLVRFGARDYNPVIGRWTAKDPILFAGGDTNLYGYALSDPVNTSDHSGLEPCTCKEKESSNKWDELGHSIAQFAAGQGMLEIGAGNSIAQIGATAIEGLVIGPLVTIDYVSGAGILRGSPELQDTMLQQFVQRGFNEAYKSEWEHLTGDCSDDQPDQPKTHSYHTLAGDTPGAVNSILNAIERLYGAP